LPRERIVSLIEDDLGDIMYHVLKLAVAYDIDAAEAFRGAMSNIKARYGKE
jgi:NTP pyrophosphatase (non-canonical NTP hydrolase)